MRGNRIASLRHPAYSSFMISGRSLSVSMRMLGTRTYPHCTTIAVGGYRIGSDPR